MTSSIILVVLSLLLELIPTVVDSSSNRSDYDYGAFLLVKEIVASLWFY